MPPNPLPGPVTEPGPSPRRVRLVFLALLPALLFAALANDRRRRAPEDRR